MRVIPTALQGPGTGTGRGEDSALGADGDSTAGGSGALQDGTTRLPPGPDRGDTDWGRVHARASLGSRL